MFIPKSFKETDSSAIQAFIASHPLATVTAITPNGIEASHVPIQWVQAQGVKAPRIPAGQDDQYIKDSNQTDYLLGHIAKINPLNNPELLDTPWLIIFQDAGHYISPNWYPSKAVTHKEVPTWNYRAVHVTGKVQLLTDSENLVDILTRLTQTFEATQPRPWSLDDAPDKYIQGLCRAIVGIRMDIDLDNVKAQFKLSQNKTVDNRVGVVAGLKKVGTAEADNMASLIDID